MFSEEPIEAGVQVFVNMSTQILNTETKPLAPPPPVVRRRREFDTSILQRDDAVFWSPLEWTSVMQEIATLSKDRPYASKSELLELGQLVLRPERRRAIKNLSVSRIMNRVLKDGAKLGLTFGPSAKASIPKKAA